jgi:hypothetical protein
MNEYSRIPLHYVISFYSFLIAEFAVSLMLLIINLLFLIVYGKSERSGKLHFKMMNNK